MAATPHTFEAPSVPWDVSDPWAGFPATDLEPASAARQKPPLLLIAEDDLPLRTWLSDALLKLGFRVTLAADGIQAVTAAVHEQPDVIFMDLVLPAMDGLQATAALKRDLRTRHIPVIALTAYSSAAERARNVGCAAFVAKPFTAEDVAIQARLALDEKSRNA